LVRRGIGREDRSLTPKNINKTEKTKEPNKPPGPKKWGKIGRRHTRGQTKMHGYTRVVKKKKQKGEKGFGRNWGGGGGGGVWVWWLSGLGVRGAEGGGVWLNPTRGD